MNRDALMAAIITDPRVLTKDSRLGLLDEPGLPREVFELLSEDTTLGFRKQVTRSPHAPADIKSKLHVHAEPVPLCAPRLRRVTEISERVRQASSPSATPGQLASLAETRCGETVAAVAINPATPSAALIRILGGRYSYSHRLIARHRAEPEVMAWIAEKGGREVRAHLATNPACPHDLRVRLLLTDDGESLLNYAQHVAGVIDPRDTALARVAAAWVRGEWRPTPSLVEACFRGHLSAYKIGFMVTMDPDLPVEDLLPAVRAGVSSYALTRHPSPLRLSTAAGRRRVLAKPSAYHPAIRLRVGAAAGEDQVGLAASSSDEHLRLGAASNPLLGGAIAALLADPDERVRQSAALRMLDALG